MTVKELKEALEGVDESLDLYYGGNYEGLKCIEWGEKVSPRDDDSDTFPAFVLG